MAVQSPKERGETRDLVKRMVGADEQRLVRTADIVQQSRGIVVVKVAVGWEGRTKELRTCRYVVVGTDQSAFAESWSELVSHNFKRHCLGEKGSWQIPRFCCMCDGMDGPSI